MVDRYRIQPEGFAAHMRPAKPVDMVFADEHDAEIAAIKAENERQAELIANLMRERDILEARAEAAERALADRSNAVKVLRAIAEGYHVFGAEDRYVVVANPAFQPDDGSDPCLVVDISTLTTEPAAPEGRQDNEPRAYIVHAPEDDYYGTGPDRLQFHPLAQRDLDNGYRQTPLYDRPSEQAVTEAMERFERIADIIERNLWRQDEKVEDAKQIAIQGAVALKAAMEAGR